MFRWIDRKQRAAMLWLLAKDKEHFSKWLNRLAHLRRRQKEWAEVFSEAGRRKTAAMRKHLQRRLLLHPNGPGANEIRDALNRLDDIVETIRRLIGIGRSMSDPIRELTECVQKDVFISSAAALFLTEQLEEIRIKLERIERVVRDLNFN